MLQFCPLEGCSWLPYPCLFLLCWFSLLYSLFLSLLSSTSFTYEYKSYVDSVAIGLTHILILDKTTDFPLLLFRTLLVIAHSEKLRLSLLCVGVLLAVCPLVGKRQLCSVITSCGLFSRLSVQWRGLYIGVYKFPSFHCCCEWHFLLIKKLAVTTWREAPGFVHWPHIWQCLEVYYDPVSYWACTARDFWNHLPCFSLKSQPLHIWKMQHLWATQPAEGIPQALR